MVALMVPACQGSREVVAHQFFRCQRLLSQNIVSPAHPAHAAQRAHRFTEQLGQRLGSGPGASAEHGPGGVTQLS